MKKKNILIGVTGGIAAYKACDLIGLLRTHNYNVKAVMTPAAEAFITELTLQTLSNNKVYKGLFDSRDTYVEHVELAKWASVAAIVPASANTIGKIAHGICDNLLTSLVMALPKKTPVIIAPAMNTNMWNNEMVNANIDKLKASKHSFRFINPKTGRLACGDYGQGHLADVADIYAAIKKACK